MAKILKGSEVVADLNVRISKDVEVLKAGGVTPALAILRVGAKEDDLFYERNAMRKCSRAGVMVKRILLPEDVSQAELLSVIDELNDDRTIHGVLMFRPLPRHLDQERICQELDPEKDVDGITDTSMAGVFSGERKGFPPCTARSCMAILEHYGVDCTGKKAVVLGRSLVIGRPVAMMLLQKNATVTICHTRTRDLPAVCREADILVAAAGCAEVVKADSLSAGQIIIDVGVNIDEAGNLCGDVRFADADAVAEAVTPVPGGVGTVTTTMLVSHVVEAALRQRERSRR